VLLKGEYF